VKTYCQKCDHPNDLGHLFCTKCGAKLVLEHVREDFETDGMLERTKGRFLWVILSLIVVVISLVVVGLWPGKPLRRDAAAPGAFDAVEAAIARLQVVVESSKMTYTNQPLKEEDINAWLSKACKRSGAKSMTVELKPDSCTVRVIFAVGPWKVAKINKTFGPMSFSRDFSFSVTTNGLVVTGAKVGHLPMFGPLVKIVADRSAKRFGDFAKEQTILSCITDAKIADGSITVAVTSRP